MTAVVLAAAFLTVVAAARSTWSPCGLSMLSTMTPLAERSRGHRFGVTAAWYLLGAVIGGVTIGGILAVGAGVVGLLDLSATAVIVVVAAVALVTGASDLGTGPELPRHRRQVNEDWFSGYRRWAYASGFGWQIGNGFATYTTTASLYAVAAVAVAAGDPLFAAALGIGFGTVRGLAIGLAFHLTTLDAVRRIHSRLDAWAEPSRVATGAAQIAVAIALIATVDVGISIAVAAIAIGTTAIRRARRTDRASTRRARPVARPVR